MWAKKYSILKEEKVLDAVNHHPVVTFIVGQFAVGIALIASVAAIGLLGAIPVYGISKLFGIM